MNLQNAYPMDIRREGHIAPAMAINSEQLTLNYSWIFILLEFRNWVHALRLRLIVTSIRARQRIIWWIIIVRINRSTACRATSITGASHCMRLIYEYNIYAYCLCISKKQLLCGVCEPHTECESMPTNKQNNCHFACKRMNGSRLPLLYYLFFENLVVKSIILISFH